MFPTNPIRQNLIVSLREIIENVDWMAPDTRKSALTKLDSFGVKVGYPDKWIDYTDLRVDDRDTFVAVVRKLSEFEHYRHAAIDGSVRVSNCWIGQLTFPLVNDE
jgi:putative endopeptidase